jgi:hypothetical protein
MTQSSSRRSELFQAAVTGRTSEPYNLTRSSAARPMSPDVVAVRATDGDDLHDPIWVRLTIEEGSYPPIAVNKAALSLFADRIQIRVPETKFTITVYFRDVFKLEPFVERYELVLHTGNFSHRRYVLAAYLPSTIPMIYEIISSKVIERNVKFSPNTPALSSSPGKSLLLDSFHSPESRRNFGLPGAAPAVDEYYSLVHTPAMSRDTARRTSGGPEHTAGPQLPPHLRLSRVSSGGAAHPSPGASRGGEQFGWRGVSNSTGGATDLSNLLALTRDSRKPPHVASAEAVETSAVPSAVQRSSNSSPPRQHGMSDGSEGRRVYQTQATSNIVPHRSSADDVAAPAPPLWLIQRNLSEIEQRERAIHFQGVTSKQSKSVDSSHTELWNGYHAEPSANEFVFDKPPPSSANPSQQKQHRSLAPPRVSPPRTDRLPRAHWAEAAAGLLVEVGAPAKGAHRTSALLPQPVIASEESIAAARDKLFSAMVIGGGNGDGGGTRAPRDNSSSGAPPTPSAQSTVAGISRDRGPPLGASLVVGPSSSSLDLIRELAPGRRPSPQHVVPTFVPLSPTADDDGRASPGLPLAPSALGTARKHASVSTRSVAPPLTKPVVVDHSAVSASASHTVSASSPQMLTADHPEQSNRVLGQQAAAPVEVASAVEGRTKSPSKGDPQRPTAPPNEQSLRDAVQAQHMRVMQELAQVQLAQKAQVQLAAEKQQQISRQQTSATEPGKSAVMNVSAPVQQQRPAQKGPDQQSAQRPPPPPPPPPTAWIGPPAPSAAPVPSNTLAPSIRPPISPRPSQQSSDAPLRTNASPESRSSSPSSKIPPSRRPMERPLPDGGGGLMRRSSMPNGSFGSHSTVSSRSATPQENQSRVLERASSSLTRSAAPTVRPTPKA